MILEVMSPSNALYSVDQKDEVGLQNNSVNKAERVGNLIRADFVRNSPFIVNPDRVARSYGESTKTNQRLSAVTSNLH